MKLEKLCEHRVNEGGSGDIRPVQRGKRGEGERAPYECKLAVVAVPEARIEQRAGCNGEENAEEGQCPGPAQHGVLENGGSYCILRHEHGGKTNPDACQPPRTHDHFDQLRGLW